MTTMPKWVFPRLLLTLLENMEDKWASLGASSFRTCGIYPLNRAAVLLKMPGRVDAPECVSPTLLEHLKMTRDTSVKHQAPRRR